MRQCAPLILVAALTAAAAPSALAQQPDDLACWPPGARADYLVYERELHAVPTAQHLAWLHEALGSETHIAGTDGDHRTIERLVAYFGGLGLEVERHDIWVLLSYPLEASVTVVSPETIELSVIENPLDNDAFSKDPGLPVGFNAYSGSGDATAGVVYANFGTKEDFQKLAELGVDCRGKVVIARYGGNFRGYKAKFAEAAGAAALIIYTDPADSGYVRGPVFPEGGYANGSYIQRGSLLTLDWEGDPLTPGWESTEDAKRLNVDELPLPRIPVQPVGWAAAQEILCRMKGDQAPDGWQGGLPCTYRVSGGDELQVRVAVKQERKIARTANVVGTLRGSRDPDRYVVIGSHHDAWGFGVSDPLAGTIVTLESARAFAEVAKNGRLPARSVKFACWGAEEFGIIGSTEWVEKHAEDLATGGVAYFNLDMSAMGPDFGAAASPSLREVIIAAARATPQARATDDTTVYEAWKARSAGEEPRLGDLGGGSDYVGFNCRAAVASASFGAGGSRGTAYHSNYDDLTWYRMIVGDDYAPALMLTRVVTAAAARLADAPLLPLDPSAVGDDTRRQLEKLTSRARSLGALPTSSPEDESAVAVEFVMLDAAARRHAAAAEKVRARLHGSLAAGSLGPPDLVRANALLLAMDRAWLVEEGIPGRPWFRSLYAATDEDSGYASWMLPGLRHAVEHKLDAERFAEREREYLRVFERLAEILQELDQIAGSEGGTGGGGIGREGE